AAQPTRTGVIYFGSTTAAAEEALAALEAQGVHLDALRLRAFPFGDGVAEFIAAHDHVFVVEQNRDAQMRSLLVNELEVNPARLVRKFRTAATLVPQPVVRRAARKTPLGVLYYGSTSPSMLEALEVLANEGVELDAMRLRAFPFPDSVADFIARHDKVFVVEQNRDAQMRSLLVNELEVDPARLVKVVHYDGTPITARFITQAITAQVQDKRENVA
ncbi:MAG: hypothetical protein ACJ8DG_03715, partial [Microvirga sp.]